MKEGFYEKILTKELENAKLEAETEGKEFNELWVPIYDKELKEKIDNCFEKVKEFPWTCEEIYKAEYSLLDKTKCNHLILKISGGKNGNGDWNDYLNEMNKIFSNLKNIFNKVWLVDWNNDCADDVSYARIGVEEKTIENSKKKYNCLNCSHLEYIKEGILCTYYDIFLDEDCLRNGFGSDNWVCKENSNCKFIINGV